MANNSVTAQVAYDGEGLRTGSMDVRDLAPALLAIGDLLQSSNRVLNGSNASLAVKVRSDFEAGSFQIYFELVQSMASQAHMFVTGDQLNSASDIARYVGLILMGAPPGILSLLQLIKMLKGRKPRVEKTLPGGMVQLSFGDNAHADVKIEVITLLSDPQVQRAAADVMKPLRSEGVEKFEVREGKRVIEEFTRADLSSFAEPEPIIQELKNVDEKRVLALKVIKPSFEDNLAWLFSDGGDGRISAIMQDHEFLARVERREISFTKGDVLRVEMHSRSYLSGDGNLRTENRIAHVLEVMIPPRPVPLFPATEIDTEPPQPPLSKKKRHIDL